MFECKSMVHDTLQLLKIYPKIPFSENMNAKIFFQAIVKKFQKKL